MGTAMRSELRPTDPRSRDAALDIVRGVALLGIFVVNMRFYAWPGYYWAMAGYEPFQSATDRWIRFAVDVFAAGKFLSIFAFLFGLGVAFQLRRAEERGEDGGAFLLRRFFVLLMLGIAHVVLLWMGDILSVYAVFGLSLLYLRSWNDRWLLRLAGLCGVAVAAFYAVLIAASWGAPAGGGGPLQAAFLEQARTAIEVYSSGSFGAMAAQRILDYQFNLTFALPGIPIPYGMFLLGFVAGRSGAWERIVASPERLRAAAWKALGGGLLLSVAGNLLQAGDAAGAAVLLAGDLLHRFGAPVLALGYIGGILLLGRSAVGRRFLWPVAAAGRMTLTNYLLQSLITTTLFLGYGFGWYGRVTPAQTLLVAGVVYALQLVWSPLWFRSFRYGPLEWLWRSLTYRSLQPMRNPRGAA